MTETTLTPAEVKPSAFEVEADPNKHIIDTMIEERCPSFASHWTWPITRRTLLPFLDYKKAREMADTMKTLTGRGSFDYMAERLDFQLTVSDLNRVPETGRCVVVCNHPTGLADGAAVWAALREVRRDVMFFANADAMRISKTFDDNIIPVEWVQEKRSPAKTRETLKLASKAFSEEKCIVIFPSGKLAKMVDKQLTEQDWFPSAVSLARKYKAPLIPMHVSARNSRLYYLFSKLNGELRDITLFHELLNKKRSKFDMKFGPAVASEALAGDAAAITERLKSHVAYAMIDDPHTPFIP